MALGGAPREPYGLPVDHDALMLGIRTGRQLTPNAIRRNSSDLSRFVEAPLDVSPVALGSPQTIPVGGALPARVDSVPAIETPGVKVGR